MSAVIRTRLVKIGSSQGIRIPKVVLEQLNLTDTIELEVQDGQLIIRRSKVARADWSAQFAHMAAHGDDILLDDELNLTAWEETGWQW